MEKKEYVSPSIIVREYNVSSMMSRYSTAKLDIFSNGQDVVQSHDMSVDNEVWGNKDNGAINFDID